MIFFAVFLGHIEPVNFVPAVAYLIRLNLPAAFSQPRTNHYFLLCSITWGARLSREMLYYFGRRAYKARGPKARRGPRAEVPRSFTSQVTPFYTDLKPRSDQKLLTAVRC